MSISNQEVDHSGEKFGRLTLLYKGEPYIAPKTNKKKQRYYCSCECGKYTEDNPKLIAYESIKNGLVKSCGCWKGLVTSKRNKENKRHNIYDLSGEYGIGYTFKEEEFYFDLEDYDLIKDYYWTLNELNYVVARTNKKKIFMHNIILKTGENTITDHINHKPNDNRKINLRNATYSQNQMNKTKQLNNKSGVTGVAWHNRDKIWVAYITVNKKRINLGNFSNFDDAVEARKVAEKEYFGEYSYDNSIKVGEESNVNIS